MKKEIKIMQISEKQIGLRLPEEIFNHCSNLAKKNNCTVQDIIRYILKEEVKNYL